MPARPLPAVNLPPLDPLRETRFAVFFDKAWAGDDFDDDDEPDDEMEQDEEDRTNDEN